jgi:hypothetical protein
MTLLLRIGAGAIPALGRKKDCISPGAVAQ